MGIESDHVVYDYLSRVGDLAQSTPLTAAERAQLVAGLRSAIDGQRAGTGGGPVSPRAEKSAVQKILKRIGTPDEVVRRAVVGGVPQPPARREVRAEERGAGPQVPVHSSAPPADQGPWSGPLPEDWWSSASDRGAGASAEEAGTGRLRGAMLAEFPGWRTTLEPDFLDLDPRFAARGAADRGAADPHGTDPDADGAARVPGPRGPAGDETVPAPGRPLLSRLLGRQPAQVAEAAADAEEAVEAVPAPVRGPLPPLASLALLVLLAAAVLGLWYVALLGWILAYVAHRIGRAAAHAAGLWLPLLVAAVFAFWFYSHTHGQPAGHQLTGAQFTASLRSTTAVWLRTAAACSTAFLAWRISRIRRG
jgi:hypothetical protein